MLNLLKYDKWLSYHVQEAIWRKLEEDAGAKGAITGTTEIGRYTAEAWWTRRLTYTCTLSFKITTLASGLDEEAAAELEAIRGNLAKYKGKMGKGFDDIAIDEIDWVNWQTF